MGKNGLSSMKSIPGAKKVGDRCPKVQPIASSTAKSNPRLRRSLEIGHWSSDQCHLDSVLLAVSFRVSLFHFLRPDLKTRGAYIMATGFPGGSAGNESACNVGGLGLIPGLGRSPGEENGYPFQYSGLENSMDCIVRGVTKRQT